MGGDDAWVIAGFELPNGDYGIYDFMLQAWLEIVPAAESGEADNRVAAAWLDANFRSASIPTSLSLHGLERPDLRRLLTRRVAADDAQIDDAIEAAPSANDYDESDIVAQWEASVTLDPASTAPPLSAELVTDFFGELGGDSSGLDFETWLDAATLHWNDNGEVLSQEEARAHLRLCRYIAACC